MINKGGRPLKFKNAKEIEDKADIYFDDTPEKEWTITGLALALDTDRITLIRYGKKTRFSNTIKRIKAKVECSYEKSLRIKGTAGDIFALKNFGWTDKQDIDITGKSSLEITFDSSFRKQLDNKDVIEAPISDLKEDSD